MSRKSGLVTRFLIPTFGGLYNDLIGRRAHLGVAAVIFDEEGRVLLVHQSYGRRAWDLPGGGREPKESLDTALQRELREEISVEISSAQLRGVYYEPSVDQHHFAFRCQLKPGAAPKSNLPEILDWGYFPIDAWPLPINDFTIQRITDARSSLPIRISVLGKRIWLSSAE
jgi:8-oxo-dGTP pyrophosphatase MutT (NUDIX family)